MVVCAPQQRLREEEGCVKGVTRQSDTNRADTDTDTETDLDTDT